MNSIVLASWQRLTDIFQLEFWQCKSGQIIAPSPAYADFIRSILGQGQLEQGDWSVNTLPEFMREQLEKTYGSEQTSQRLVGRTRLKLYLARVLRQFVPQLTRGEFESFYHLYTDLRSFTQNEELFKEVAALFPDAQREILLVADQFVRKADLWDESAALDKLTPLLAKYSSKQFVFWGFSLMSGVQIDFIKNLSLSHPIAIIVPDFFLQKLRDTDWPSWIELDKRSSSNIEMPSVKACVAPQGHLPQMIAQLPEIDHCLVMGEQSLSCPQWFYLPPMSSGQRLDANPFHEAISIWESELQQRLQNQNLDFLYEVDKRSELIQRIAKGNIPLIRVWLTFFSIWDDFLQWPIGKVQFGIFELKLFEELIRADLPRLSLLGLNKNSNHEMKAVSLLESLSCSLTTEAQVSIVLNPDWLPQRGSEKVIPFPIESKLMALGPIARSQLPLWSYQAHLIELMRIAKGRCQLFYSPELVEKDVLWDEFISHLNLERVIYKREELSSKSVLPTGKRFIQNHISVSALQTYIDCPRKFYQLYLENWSEFLILKSEIKESEKGDLWHDLLHKAFQQKIEKNKVHAFFEKEIGIWLRKKEKRISSTDQRQFVDQTNKLLTPTLDFLNELEIKYRGQGLFEKPLEFIVDNIKVKGRFDFILVQSDQVRIIDFKKSLNSVPAKNEFLSFNAIQLWAYAYCEKNVVGLCHLPLEDGPAEGLFYGEWSGQKSMTINWNEMLEHFYQQLSIVISKIKNDQIFSPNPRASSICRMCDFRVFCSKGKVDEVTE